MALELFKPFVIKELVERELAQILRVLRHMIERSDDAVMGRVED